MANFFDQFDPPPAPPQEAAPAPTANFFDQFDELAKPEGLAGVDWNKQGPRPRNSKDGKGVDDAVRVAANRFSSWIGLPHGADDLAAGLNTGFGTWGDYQAAKAAERAATEAVDPTVKTIANVGADAATLIANPLGKIATAGAKAALPLLENAPKAAKALELATGLAQAPTKLGRITQLAGQGAAAGGAYSGLATEGDLSDRLESAAIGAAIGGGAGGVLGGLGAAASPLWAKAKARLAASQEALNDALPLGVKLTRGQATGGKGDQRWEQWIRTTLGGEKIDNAYLQAEKDLGEAVIKAAGPRATTQETGQLLQQGAANALKRFEGRRLEIDEKVFANVGADAPVPVTNTEKIAGELKAALQQNPRSQGGIYGPALKEAEAIAGDAAAGGGYQFGALREKRTDLGDTIFKAKKEYFGKIPKAAQKQQALYDALRSDIQAAADAVGPRTGQLQRRHDRYVTLFSQGRRDLLEKLANAEPEKALGIALQNSKDGGSNLGILRKALPKEDFDALAGNIFARLGAPTPVQAQGAVNEFSAATFLTNWHKLSPEAKSALFGSAPFRDKIEPILRTAGRIKDTARLANHSNTATNIVRTLQGGSLSGTALNLGLDPTDDGAQKRFATALGVNLLPLLAARRAVNPNALGPLAAIARRMGAGAVGSAASVPRRR